ncbi:MAG: class I SAM-dependent methyltransferase [Streptosporangiaceae bacterium]
MGTFAGDTAENYARYRRGYPDTIVAAVIGHLRLGPDDTVIDLGCGTGLLTAPVARNVGLVVGVDPEADMLAIARRQAEPGLNSKVVWVLGSDDDLPAVARLLGDGSVGAVTVGQALHFMDYENLFLRARRLLRPGGGIAVIANGVPLWQQDSQWSHCLRMALNAWFRTTTTATCGTDRATQARYANALSAAGYEVHEVVEEYEADLTLEEVLGGLHSAMSRGDVPDDLRDAFAQHITAALPDLASFTETVRVDALIGVAR